MSARKPLGACLALCLFALLLAPAGAQADFGIGEMSASVINEDGSPDLQAGSDPYEFRFGFAVNQDAEGHPEGTLRDVIIDLPQGMVGNPLAVPRCPAALFEGLSPHCPGNTQVGTLVAHLATLPPVPIPLYNLTPPLGVPASIGVSIANNDAFNEASLRSSDYGVRVSDLTVPTKLTIRGVEARIWGLPAASTHDSERHCIVGGEGVDDCASDSAPTPFLTLPTSCGAPLKWTLAIDSVQEPGLFQTQSVESKGPGGTPRGLTGCNEPPFNPTIAARPETTTADSPSGLRFHLRIPQSQYAPVEKALPAHDEEQSLSVFASSGGFHLGFEEQETGELPFNATAAQVKAALNALGSISAGGGSVSVSGGPGGLNPLLISFDGGPLADKNVAQLEVLPSFEFTGGRAEAETVINGQAPGKVGVTAVTPNLASANLKDTVVKLPAGLAVDPSTADGRSTCPLTGPEGINLPGSGEPAQGEAAKCPESSKVGTVEVHTPLVDHPIKGTVYLARQGENPFGSLIALYVAVNDPLTGVVVKLAGKVVPDPVTGQLTATFENNPQLPFEDFEFEFFGGPRAALTTPPTCGTYTTTTDLTPWTSPEGSDAFPSDSFAISTGPAGPCAPSEAQMPNSPSFEAGSTTPLAGAYAPFVVKMSRENGSQRFAALNTTLPPGVAANFNGVTECSEAQIAQARSRSGLGQGALEAASPSCPPGSQIGTVTVGAGSGNPLYVNGKVYLAGPYKGAPFSLAIITPGVAGPFDIGTVVVRAALYVNETTGQATVKSDPIPTILAGIPLDVRSVAVKVDRSGYVLNPTSCEAKAVAAEEISAAGQIAHLRSRFQVGGCKGLDFSPKLALSMKGGTKRSDHPAFKAVLTQPAGQANIARTSVTMPPTEFIDQNHISNPCTRAQFNEGKCPPASILGTARAFTPLFEAPLEGKVYFRSNGGERELPDVVADLNGKVHIVLVGFVDAVHHKGSESSRVRTTFATVPDAPVSKFVLSLKGGKKGLLVNSANICKVANIATVKMTAQNNKVKNLDEPIATSCKK
jgi:hypothetical protein